MGFSISTVSNGGGLDADKILTGYFEVLMDHLGNVLVGL